jgi:hypothetical protein
MWNRIRRIALAASALALPLTAPAQAQDCTLKQMASLPLLDPTNAVIAVPVSINGSERPFVVDTGGIYSMLSVDVAKEMGLDVKIVRDQQFYASDGTLLDKGVTIDSLMIGHNEAKHIHLLLYPNFQSRQLAGTLAPDLLKLFDVDIDFAARKLNLFSPDHCEGKVVYWAHDYVELPFTSLNRDDIRLEATLDGHALTAELDTGTSRTTLLNSAAVQTFHLDAESPNSEKVEHPSLLLYRHRFDSLSLNGVAVNHLMVDVIADAIEQSFYRRNASKAERDPIYGDAIGVPPLILGADVLRHLHLYIAYKERKLYLTAANVPPPAPAPPPAAPASTAPPAH